VSSGPASSGRRVLIAIVTGLPGEVIQQWRHDHDPRQARRIPPHATLCYEAPPIGNAGALDRQIRHAFPGPVTVTLGGVYEFANHDGTFFTEMTDTSALSAARTRLFDGAFCPLAGRQDFTWHVTCVRYPEDAKRESLRAAARDLTAAIAEAPTWIVDTIAWMELHDGIYEPLRIWSLREQSQPTR
jgi:hypothetical protein